MRICNFELAAELYKEEKTGESLLNQHVSDLIDLEIDACSMVYASPVVLNEFKQFTLSNAKLVIPKEKVVKKYNPFKEDVYSLGLTLL